MMNGQAFRICIMVILAGTLMFTGPLLTFGEEAGAEKSYYSPIVRLEAERGFFLITTDSGILWIQVEDHVKPHLETLGTGDMIDVVVQFRPDNLPPLLKSWKLASGSSPCKVFDGKTCRKE